MARNTSPKVSTPIPAPIISVPSVPVSVQKIEATFQPAKLALPHEFPVSLERLQLTDGTLTDKFTMVRRDLAEPVCFGTFGEGYKTVSHSETVGRIEEGITKANLSGFERKISLLDNGGKMFADWTFKNRTIPVTKKVGDQLAFRITARNSLDGSLSLGLEDSILRLACLNGATRWNVGEKLGGKHTQSLDLEAISEGIKKMLARFEVWASDLSLLVLPITQAQGGHILRHAEKAGIFSGKARDGVQAEWDNPKDYDSDRTLYSLWNAATAFTTHRLGNDKFELARSISGKFTNFAVELGKNRAKFEEALTPVSDN